MLTVICPGMHPPELTAGIVQVLPSDLDYLVLPTPEVLPYSPLAVSQFLQAHCSVQIPLLLVCFSAGVVGGLGAAWHWQAIGGQISALVAWDGWGVPLPDAAWGSNFPSYRLSHDYFTHWSSHLLGGDRESFYAEPAVEHLQLWANPRQAQGWHIGTSESHYTTAADFLQEIFDRYRKS